MELKKCSTQNVLNEAMLSGEKGKAEEICVGWRRRTRRKNKTDRTNCRCPIAHSGHCPPRSKWSMTRELLLHDTTEGSLRGGTIAMTNFKQITTMVIDVHEKAPHISRPGYLQPTLRVAWLRGSCAEGESPDGCSEAPWGSKSLSSRFLRPP